jgi:hypothetical protein
MMWGRIRMVLVAALAAAGCGPAGSGDIVSDVRDLPTFDRIHVEEGIDVDLRIEPGAAQAVTVVYDDNLLDRIGTEVVDGELRVEVTDSFRVTGGGRLVEVAVAELDQIEADSGADVRGRGEIGLIRVVASGGASVDLVDLAARNVVVEASGGAVVLVTARDSVTGQASGGSNVDVYGDPPTVDVATSGGADVDRRP